MQKEKNRSRGLRAAQKYCKFEKIKKEMLKTKKTNQGIKASSINKILTCTPNFIGCFAENEVTNLTITSYPCSLIINLDHDNLPGSHWVAVYISKETLEVWDTLGFRILDWPRIPCNLLKFLHRYVFNRRVIISKRIQSSSSILCGYFCIYFIICRQFLSFQTIVNTFNSDFNRNDNILLNCFSYELNLSYFRWIMKWRTRNPWILKSRRDISHELTMTVSLSLFLKKIQIFSCGKIRSLLKGLLNLIGNTFYCLSKV